MKIVQSKTDQLALPLQSSEDSLVRELNEFNLVEGSLKGRKRCSPLMTMNITLPGAVAVHSVESHISCLSHKLAPRDGHSEIRIF